MAQASAPVIFARVPVPVEPPFSPEKTKQDAAAKRAEKIAEHDQGKVDHFEVDLAKGRPLFQATPCGWNVWDLRKKRFSKKPNNPNLSTYRYSYGLFPLFRNPKSKSLLPKIQNKNIKDTMHTRLT